MSVKKRVASDHMYPPKRGVRKSDAKLIASAGPFKVTSRVGGSFEIEAAWTANIPKGCKVSPENYCHAHGCYHIGGVFTRMAIAEAIQALLSAAPEGRPPGPSTREGEDGT